MRNAILLALALSAAPVAAMAQEERAPLFVAPWGEPVRGADGVAAIQVWFTRTDVNQDGRLTLDEFLAPAAAFHDVLDRNDDGIVTSAESGALFRATAPEVFALPPARVPAQAPPGGMTQQHQRRAPVREEGLRGAARFGLFGDVEPVMSCDADLSRWISREEFQACVERRFRALDANNDGAFELSESPRAAELLAGE